MIYQTSVGEYSYKKVINKTKPLLLIDQGPVEDCRLKNYAEHVLQVVNFLLLIC